MEGFRDDDTAAKEYSPPRGAILPDVPAPAKQSPRKPAFPEARVDAAPEARQGGAVATEEDVRRLSMALPGVAERLSWAKPAWFARTLMARMWEDGVAVKTAERDVLEELLRDSYRLASGR